MKIGERLSVVIPAHNEVGGISGTLNSLREGLPECEIIVVDDGSTDGTGDQVRAFPDVTLAHHEYNRGYGASLKTGMRLATREYLAWFDGDGEHRVEDLTVMAERLEQERLVAVIGHRTKPGRSLFRQAGKLGIRLLARSLGVRAGSDLNCGLRVFRRDVIVPLSRLLPDGFSASMTSTMVMLAQRYPTAFQPVGVKPRIGESKVVLRDGFRSLLLVLRVIMLFAPLRIFLVPGAILLAIGAVYGFTTALVLRAGLPTAALFLMNAGMMLSMLGLIADQVSQTRLEQLRLPEIERATRRSSDPTPSDD